MAREAPQKREPYLRFVRPHNLLKSPTYVKPGFKESASAFSGLGDELAERGHNVYALDEPPRLNSKDRERELQKAIDFARTWYTRHHPTIDREALEQMFLSIPKTLFEGALQLIHLIEQETSKGTPVQALGHSRGAFETVLAAFLRPDLFPTKNGVASTITLLNPAGLTGKEGVHESLALRASQKVRDERVGKARKTFGEWASDGRRMVSIMYECLVSTVASYVRTPEDSPAKPSMKAAFSGALGFLFSNPLRAAQEAHDMANTDLLMFIEFTHRVNGVRYGLVIDRDDTLFKRDIMLEHIQGHDYIEVRETSGGTHFAPITKPEDVAGAASEILNPQRHQ